MRKTFIQCCFALLLGPILAAALIVFLVLPAVAADNNRSTRDVSTSTSTNTGLSKIEVEITIDGMDQSGFSMLYGDRTVLSARVRAYYGTDTVGSIITSGAYFQWSSSNIDVAKISSTTSSVEATKEGNATLTCTATFGGEIATATCTVTVKPRISVIITQYDFSTTKIEDQAGTTIPLKALVVVNNETFNNKTVTWESDTPAVATVNGSGVVNTIAPGTAKITATYTDENDNKYTCTVTCTVRAGGSSSTGPGGNDPGTSTPSGELPEGITVDRIVITAPEQGAIMERGTQNITAVVYFSDSTSVPVEWSRDGSTSTATYVSNTGSKHTIGVTWSSTDRNVASVASGRITADQAGEVTITAATIGDKKTELKVTVRGFALGKDELVLEENESVELLTSGVLETYGNPDLSSLTIYSDNTTVATYEEGRIKGLNPGVANFTISSRNGSFRGTIKVTVEADRNARITAGTIKNTETLPFRTLLSDFGRQAGGNLSHITGLNVSPAQGSLFYNYRSAEQPGVGVGSGTYYNPNRSGGIPSGQQSLADITFVPKSGYAGEVTIYYTAISETNQNYACRITLTVTAESSDSSSISLSTKYNTPVKFSATEFNKVCREKTGLNLSYVTFSQPPERQGTLYTNYVSAGNYGSLVNLRTQYNQNELDNVWFVPAPGYSGTVTVYYTAHTTGTSSETYTGQVIIKVESETGSTIGGLHYETAQGGAVRFDDVDFNDYCRELLDSYQTLSFIRFDSLPSASEGVLYYDYTSASNTGSPASLDTSYCYGTRVPRIDRLTFVAAEGYVGTVRIPFTGYTIDGTRFTGNVEINVRSGAGVGTGDIQYICAPGRTVSFKNSDFTSLSQVLANRTLDYIVFQSLPSTTEGSLYYNSTRISTTGTRYSNGSGNRIANLSFRASNSFSGWVDIPFEGHATNGVTFYGVITISSNGSGSSTSPGNIRYVTDSKTAAVFDRDDFDDLSLWETDRSVSSVRFELPATSQGALYRGYRSSSSQGTRITSSSTSISASDLDRVAFIPASGFTGTVYLDFTATASSGGGTFTGTVEIEVGRPAADVIVRYSTRTAPVDFRSSDFGRSGSTLSSIRLTSLPSTSAGYLYYQYTSPTRYGRMASTSTTYRTSGSDLISDLTFVPRAGYSGTVTMGYVGTNSNGSTFEGEVLITVSPSYTSSYFTDMGSYNDAQRAAVDFLRENGITNGVSATQYGPEQSITRGDFAVMVYQAFGLTSSGSANAFYDVPSGVYYAQAVNTLHALGIVSGIGNGAYAPQGTLSRQDAVCMIQRAMRALGWNAGDGYASVLSGYSDASSVAGYAQGAMANAIQVGWLPTYSGRLDPRGALTRVDMAEMIHRALTY